MPPRQTIRKSASSGAKDRQSVRTKGKGKGKSSGGSVVVPLDFELDPARPEDPKRSQREIAFLNGLNVSSQDAAQEVMKILSPAAAGQEVDVVVSCCKAFGRLVLNGQVRENRKCLVAILNNQGVECLRTVRTVMEQVNSEVAAALKAMSKTAVEFVDGADHIDFHQLPKVILYFNKLHRDSDLVCRSALSTLQRFAKYDSKHRLTMLNDGVMQGCAFILKNYRQPELLRLTIALLTTLSAPPMSAEAALHVTSDPEFLASVVKLLEERPVDTALQLAGFRLLSVWGRAEAELWQLVMDSGAAAVLRKAHTSLNQAGLPHIASWLWTIAGRTLVEETGPTPPWFVKPKAESPKNKKGGGKGGRKTIQKG